MPLMFEPLLCFKYSKKIDGKKKRYYKSTNILNMPICIPMPNVSITRGCCGLTDKTVEKIEKVINDDLEINHYKQIVKSLYLTNIAVQNYNLTQKEKKRKRR